MSRRTSIVKALTGKFKTINGIAPYKTNIFGNAFPILKFWDEVADLPALYITPGSETREYLPAQFTWGFLNICVKVYVKGENATDQLEDLLEDVEKCIDANRSLVYDETNSFEVAEILVQSIITDEGLLAPYAVGEITAQVRYQIM